MSPVKGEQKPMRYLARADVIRVAAGLDPVTVVKEALTLHASGATTLPDEAYLGWTDPRGQHARSLALPAALWGAEPAVGMKVINSCLSNPGYGLPRAQGVTLVFDRDTAHPVAIMEAAYLSALRTSAYSALTVDLLGPPDPATVAVVGCGALGEAHIRMLAPRLPGAAFVLYDEAGSRSAALAATLRDDGVPCRTAPTAEDAVRGAGIVVTTTTTTVGWLPFAWLAPGALILHVSLDDVLPDVVRQAGLVVVDDWDLIRADDRRLFGRLYRSGELRGPDDTEPAGARGVDATLAGIVSGRHPGRAAADQVILSNPFGMGILDVALAARVWRAAERTGVGLCLPR